MYSQRMLMGDVPEAEPVQWNAVLENPDSPKQMNRKGRIAGLGSRIKDVMGTVDLKPWVKKAGGVIGAVANNPIGQIALFSAAPYVLDSVLGGRAEPSTTELISGMAQPNDWAMQQTRVQAELAKLRGYGY